LLFDFQQHSNRQRRIAYLVEYHWRIVVAAVAKATEFQEVARFIAAARPADYVMHFQYARKPLTHCVPPRYATDVAAVAGFKEPTDAGGRVYNLVYGGHFSITSQKSPGCQSAGGSSIAYSPSWTASANPS
jgi:hypothetical protein